MASGSWKGATGLWTDPNQWSGGAVPDTEADIVASGSYTVLVPPASQMVKTLDLDAAGATIDITANATLTIQGVSFGDEGTLTLAAGTITGNELALKNAGLWVTGDHSLDLGTLMIQSRDLGESPYGISIATGSMLTFGAGMFTDFSSYNTVSGGGTLVNEGSIEVSTALTIDTPFLNPGSIFADYLMFQNNMTAADLTGILTNATVVGAVFYEATLTNTGTISLTQGSPLDGVWLTKGSELQGGTVLAEGGNLVLNGVVTFDGVDWVGRFQNNATLVAAGTTTIDGPLVNTGSMLVSAGADLAISALADGFSNTGVFGIKAGGTLGFTEHAVNAGTVTLNTGFISFNGAGRIDFAGSGVVGGTVAQFGTADVLTFSSTPYSASVTADYSNGTLTVEDGTTVLARLAVDTVGNSRHFVVNPFVEGGETITQIDLVTCFAAGTRIAIAAGGAAVENLRIGDGVLTASGAVRPVKWIGRRAYDGRFIAGNRNVLPIRIRAGALAESVPARDLLVSPHHAMLLDGVLVPAEKLVNGVSIMQEEAVERVEYFHIELDSHDVLLAEGAAAESFVDCDSRGLFQNAAEFAALYPEDDAPRWRFCAPRVEDGPVLAAIRARLGERAGLGAAAPGPLRGQADRMGRFGVEGWARDEDHPNRPVALELRIDGEIVAGLIAQAHRPDLEAAGFGEGRHGFRLDFAGPLDGRPHLLSLHRVADGAELPGSPVLLAPAVPGRVGAGGLDCLLTAARRLVPSAQVPARVSA